MSAVDRFIEKEIAGQKRKLLKPTRRMRDRLCESAHAWGKERLSHNLRLAGIDGEEMLPHLSEFDERKATTDDLLNYVNVIGVTELLELSLKDYGDETAAIVDAVEDPMTMACELWGWEITPAASDVIGEAGEENPQKPAGEPADDKKA